MIGSWMRDGGLDFVGALGVFFYIQHVRGQRFIPSCGNAFERTLCVYVYMYICVKVPASWGMTCWQCRTCLLCPTASIAISRVHVFPISPICCCLLGSAPKARWDMYHPA